jgi:hypothetical protein
MTAWLANTRMIIASAVAECPEGSGAYGPTTCHAGGRITVILMGTATLRGVLISSFPALICYRFGVRWLPDTTASVRREPQLVQRNADDWDVAAPVVNQRLER